MARSVTRFFSGYLRNQFSGVRAMSLPDTVLDQFSQTFDFGIRKMLHSDKKVLCRAHANQFVELDLDRRVVSILRVLDQKDHQKRHYRCAGVYDELPRVCVAEERGLPASRETAFAIVPKYLWADDTEC